ncbi:MULTISPECIES: STAS domain-containing protein [unclassified Streptomyces]|uniref:STAS domain-containing protein n=1 Tax=unclassified Streptomyces TaxID=2593676 RepID=UPI0033ACE056
MHLIPRQGRHLEASSSGGRTVVALRGELDLALVRRLRPGLDALVREADALTLDIRGLTFCDASGLGLLVRCARRTRERGARWRLLCDQPRILRLIRLTALCDVLRPEPAPPGGPGSPCRSPSGRSPSGRAVP